ncbi:HD domain-containing phosphohydrolase [Gottschalkia acidurici]|nr:HD domain-containing phosphohydrolase [Gottschalkia acidurici]
MRAQIIAKEANQKFQNLQALEGELSIETKTDLEAKIIETNTSIEKAKRDFSSTLDSLKKGEINTNKGIISVNNPLNDTENILDHINKDWEKYSEAVSVIVESSEISKDTIEALEYINENSEKLIYESDFLVQKILENNNDRINKSTSIMIILLIVFTVLITITLRELTKYIITPLDKLFGEIDKVGVLKKDFKNNYFVNNELTPIVSEIDEGFKKLNGLIELIENISKDMSFDEVLNYIYNSFSPFIPYQHIGIALLNEEKQELEASYGISEPSIGDLPKKLVGIKAKLSDTSLENIIKNSMARTINDLEKYVYGKETDYNRVLLSEGIKSSISLPLRVNRKVIGVIFFSSVNKNVYKEEHINFLETIASSIAISFNKSIFIDELIYSSTLALAKMAESRDEDTGEHLEGMKQYTKLIAECLVKDGLYLEQLTISYIKDLEKFAPMHDIGKVGVPDGILLKAGKLTDEEFKAMRNHAIYGGEILRVAEENIMKQHRSLYKLGIEIAEGHHEKWDGTGYPHNVSGEDIPLSARIVAMADVFDALTSKRVYKEAFSFEKSFNIIVEGKGKHFDPYIVESFINHKDDIFKLYKSFNHQQ